jgi:GDP-L-fucose synthase
MFNLSEFYKDKTVLVAGASGMTGHNLKLFLENLPCKKVVGTSYSTTDNPFIPVDFTSKEATKSFFDSQERFDYVFICCAKTYNALVCKENPQAMTLPNIEMAANLLENSLRTGVKKVLFISSSTVYQPSFTSMSEEDLDWNLDPNPLYLGVGWAKRYIEKLCQFYSTLGLETLVVRPTNIYGPHDKTDLKTNHVIPALILKALDKQDPYVIFGNGRAVKDFIYVHDFVRDIAKVTAICKGFDVLNLCSGSLCTIEEAAQAILRETGHKPKQIVFTSQAPDQVPFRALSRTKFDTLCGRNSYKPFSEGLKETVQWLSSLHQTQK